MKVAGVWHGSFLVKVKTLLVLVTLRGVLQGTGNNGQCTDRRRKNTQREEHIPLLQQSSYRNWEEVNRALSGPRLPVRKRLPNLVDRPPARESIRSSAGRC
jgi:hypothetical protein